MVVLPWCVHVQGLALQRRRINWFGIRDCDLGRGDFQDLVLLAMRR